MANITILYWRDIPAQITAEKGRRREREQSKLELHRRFSLAIDEAAMRDGADGADDYLGEWRRGESKPCSDDIASETKSAIESIEAEYTNEKLAKLVNDGGWELSQAVPESDSYAAMS